MAKIEERPTIELEVTIRLTEVEARYLYNLASYNHDTILKALEAATGTAYTKEYNQGFHLFLQGCESLGDAIRKTDQARMVFTGQRVVTKPKDADHG